MADPLSATASAIAVVGAVVKACDIVQKLWLLRYANQDLLELCNEVSAFSDVIKSVQGTLQLTTPSIPDSTGVSHLLNSLEDVCQQAMGPLDELRILSETRLVKHRQGRELQVSKWGWIRHKKLVNRLRESIKTSRDTLSPLLLALLTRSNVPQVQMKHIAPKVSSIGNVQNPSSNDGPNMPAGLEVDIQFNHLQAELSDKRTLASAHYSLDAYSQSNSGTLAKVAIKSTHRCERFCPCRCHTCLNIRSPSWLEFALGALTWRTNVNVTLARQSCDFKACKRTGTATFRLSYIAPKWALMGALSFQLIGLSIGGPYVSIRPVRVIPRDAAVWPLVQCGAIDRLQQLFAKGEFSPFDVRDDGTSLLHYAGMNGQVDTCSFLVHNGADKYFQNCRGITAIQPGLDIFLNDKVFNANNASIFVEETFSDEQGFTFLHRVALGLCQIDLRTQLKQKAFGSLDVLDSNWRTPLLWAAWTGNVGCVELLIEYGAALDYLDLENETALSKACRGGHVNCTEMLLQAGASPDKGNCYYIQPIHYASQRQYCIAIRLLDALIRHGASINATTDSLATPLHFAAGSGIMGNVDYLIQHNATLKARNTFGVDASLMALANWHDDLFCHLVRIGADIHLPLDNGLNVLHVAAWAGSYNSWVVIAEAARGGRLCGIDINSRHDGHTVWECLGNCRQFRSNSGGKANVMEINNIKQILENIRILVTGSENVKLKYS